MASRPGLSSGAPSGGRNPFVELFAFVATVDTTPYLCVPAALQFRAEVCGGEERIRQYCQDITRKGGQRIAEILASEVMDNKTRTLTECCFTNVRLPLAFSPTGNRSSTAITTSSGHAAAKLAELHLQEDPPDGDLKFSADEAPKMVKWIIERALVDFDIPLMTKFHAGAIWVRLSGQIYVQLEDFERAGEVLKGLCERVGKGEWR